MSEHFAFYSTAYDSLPDETMQAIVADAELSRAEAEDGGRNFHYAWPDLQILCSEMPAEQVPAHLEGFAGWLTRIYQGSPDARGNAILERLRATRLVVGVVVEPRGDDERRAERLLSALRIALDAIMLVGSALYDAQGRLLLAPDGTFDPAAAIDVSQPPATAEPAAYQVTDAQRERYARVAERLRVRQVPLLAYPLYVPDEAQVSLRSAADAARRLLILSAVTLRADGAPREEAATLLDQKDLWPAVSPEERKFLEEPVADLEVSASLLWRLESAWTLLWALGEVDEHESDGQMCDMARLTLLLQRAEADPNYIANAQLRSKAEILDALQETLLLHWAVRDAWVHRQPIPENLDWNSDSARTSVDQAPIPGILEERHHTLNWLTRFGGAEWDDVLTPT